jgi:hypothetical protein
MLRTVIPLRRASSSIVISSTPETIHPTLSHRVM